jgi:hypothetical protein
MRRVTMTDGSGRWLDLDTTQAFEEDTRFDGRNRISVATGSQWEHETLYRTAAGTWVLHHTSAWQGTLDTWEEIDEADAHRWLVANGEAAAVPADALEALAL